MGVAIIVPDVSFQSANLGRVTIIDTSDLVGISIVGKVNVTGTNNAETYTIDYTPSTTTHVGVIWSIVSGGQYATIDSATGVLSILQGANNASVTIRAISTYDSSIYADKTIAVTYRVPLEDLTNYLDFGQGTGYYETDIVLAATDKVKIVFEVNANGIHTILGSRSIWTKDNNSMLIETDGSGYPLKFKNGGVAFQSAQAPAVNTKYVLSGNYTGVECTPSVGAWTQSAYAYNAGIAINIGNMRYGDGHAHDQSKWFFGRLYGIEVYDANDTLTHRLIPQSNGDLLDEVTDTAYQVTGTIIYG